MRVRVSDVGTQDVRFAWHHLQLWAEFYEGRFEVLRVGHADTFAYYVEAKYKFTPQLFGALRWNQQLFGNVNDGYGGRVRWSQDLGRIDIAATYRFTTHTQLKLHTVFNRKQLAWAMTTTCWQHNSQFVSKHLTPKQHAHPYC
jgi:predicted porin